MMKKNAIVMSLGDPSGDPRPKRMVDLLKNQGFVVDLMSHACKTDLGVNQHFIIPITYSLLGKVKRRLVKYAVGVASILSFNDSILDKFNAILFGFNHDFCRVVNNKYDLIIVEDLYLLPLAFQIKQNAKVIFDAREYYPRQNEESLLWRLMEKPERLRLCRKYPSNVDMMLTVSPGLANEYEKEFAIKPIVFRSTPNYLYAKPTKTAVKQIRLVHHGVANKNRQLEKMIDVAVLLDDRFTLDLYLTGNSSYIRSLIRYAQKCPKVRIHPPVNFDSLHSMLVGYDVGFYFLIPSGFNVTYNLPNKLFEFIQARLAVAIGPSPDMSAIVRQYECGVVSERFSVESMAITLNALTADDVDLLKSKSDLAARELNFEVESEVFLNALRQFN
jgi:hypothetical protein